MALGTAPSGLADFRCQCPKRVHVPGPSEPPAKGQHTPSASTPQVQQVHLLLTLGFRLPSGVAFNCPTCSILCPPLCPSSHTHTVLAKHSAIPLGGSGVTPPAPLQEPLSCHSLPSGDPEDALQWAGSAPEPALPCPWAFLGKGEKLAARGLQGKASDSSWTIHSEAQARWHRHSDTGTALWEPK